MRTATPTNDAAGGRGPAGGPSSTGAQDAPTSSTAMWNVPAYFLAGALMLGAPGWALDAWLGTRGFVAVGVLAGVALAFYVIWVRYVGPATAAGADAGGAHPARSDEESA